MADFHNGNCSNMRSDALWRLHINITYANYVIKTKGIILRKCSFFTLMEAPVLKTPFSISRDYQDSRFLII